MLRTRDVGCIVEQIDCHAMCELFANICVLHQDENFRENIAKIVYRMRLQQLLTVLQISQITKDLIRSQ
jgi:hypothetical protein